jgi:histidine triad (HIT) family protein
MMTDNIFLKIIDKKIPAKIIHEDERCLAFHDINPQAPVHVLIIPRKVIATHDQIREEDRELLGHLHLVAAKLAQQLGLGDGYRLVLNCRERAGQTVPHLHLHLLGGRALSWPPG